MSLSSRIAVPGGASKRSLGALLAQLLRFCLVGGLNTFVDVLVFNLLLGMRLSVFPKDHEGDLALPANPRLLMSPRSLSVILPAYNEEALIGQTLLTVMSVLTSWMHDFEVIVVNDGSHDRTAEIVARLAASDRRIRLITHPINKGYGAALVTGFEAVS